MENTIDPKRFIDEFKGTLWAQHRDPKRINRILGLLEKFWSKQPDMRFGQLLINLHVAPNSDFWNVEDDETEKKLKKFKGWEKLGHEKRLKETDKKIKVKRKAMLEAMKECAEKMEWLEKEYYALVEEGGG